MASFSSGLGFCDMWDADSASNKESYHVPSALAAASPLANVRNVHELNSRVERVTRRERNVNSG